MKRKILFFAFVLLALSNVFTSNAEVSSIDDQNNDIGVEELNFRFIYKFAAKEFFIYKCTIDTDIKRTFPDSSSKNFKRKEEVYITLRDPSGIKDGFAILNTGIDSIYYEFSDGQKEIKWWSQSDTDEYPTNPDFDKRSAILGKFFLSTISPYFEVAKIDGKLLARYRKDLLNVPDTTLRTIFQQAVSDENLKLYTDLSKNVIKAGRFARDSTWKMYFSMPIEGIPYSSDTAKVTFYLYDSKNYHVKAEMPFMKPDCNRVAPVVGLNRVLLPVDSTSYSSGFWDVTFSPRGRFHNAVGEFKTIAHIKLDNDMVTDTIKTKMKYELVKTYRWRN